MKRLGLSTILAIVIGFLLCPLIALAQQADRPARVGLLINGGPGPLHETIRRDLREDLSKLGYIEGRDIAIEPRFAQGQLDRLPALATELVDASVDVIVAYGGPAARAGQKATTQIPVIFAIVTDPVALGLVASMQRPGGNVTGLTSLDPAQVGEEFALLKEVIPSIRRVAILSDQTIPGADAAGLAPIDRAHVEAARAAGLQPQIVKVKGADELESAIEAMKQQRAEAVLVLDTPVPLTHRKRVVELAMARRLPTLLLGGMRDAGGMLTYGTSVANTWRRVPVYIDRILKGQHPGDIPVEAVTRRELVVNEKAAREMGVAIPPDVLRRADAVTQ